MKENCASTQAFIKLTHQYVSIPKGLHHYRLTLCSATTSWFRTQDSPYYKTIDLLTPKPFTPLISEDAPIHSFCPSLELLRVRKVEDVNHVGGPNRIAFWYVVFKWKSASEKCRHIRRYQGRIRDSLKWGKGGVNQISDEQATKSSNSSNNNNHTCFHNFCFRYILPRNLLTRKKKGLSDFFWCILGQKLERARMQNKEYVFLCMHKLCFFGF